MGKIFYSMTIGLAIATIGCIVTYINTSSNIMLTLAITFGTTFYHFVYRLIVGYGLFAIYHNHMDYSKNWFQERSFEKSLYKAIHVKKWKNKMPTFHPTWFDISKHSIEDIIMTGCEAEVGHEINVLLSFIPLILIFWFGAPTVFIITSVAGAIMDLIFVIIQRYNRPRLVAIIKKQAEVNSSLSPCK